MTILWVALSVIVWGGAIALSVWSEKHSAEIDKWQKRVDSLPWNAGGPKEEMRIQETEAVFEEARNEMLVAFDAELRGPKEGKQ